MTQNIEVGTREEVKTYFFEQAVVIPLFSYLSH